MRTAAKELGARVLALHLEILGDTERREEDEDDAEEEPLDS